MTEEKIIYGDGKNEVVVTEGEVVISDGNDIVTMSHAAFREVVIGWRRFTEKLSEEES